jgi:hypothetical protein
VPESECREKSLKKTVLTVLIDRKNIDLDDLDGLDDDLSLAAPHEIPWLPIMVKLNDLSRSV